MSIVVEACVDSVASSLAAERGGADRLELCAALFDGGTTPSAGMIAACRDKVSIPVFVIIRPRGGSFVYSDHEAEVMRRDVVIARGLGVDGIVTGCLRPDGTIDIDLLRDLLEASRGLPLTFHRAFDFSLHLPSSLEAIIDAGAARVLTSGGAPTAVEGAGVIDDLVRQAGSRISVIAGGGIRDHNVQDVLSMSGVREVHVRLTKLAHSAHHAERTGVSVRKPLPHDDGVWEETDEERVRSFVNAVAFHGRHDGEK
ncbi:MAG TPA: copper homeostasis protein CutC [Gemmatimonadaceae bacterium]